MQDANPAKVLQSIVSPAFLVYPHTGDLSESFLKYSVCIFVLYGPPRRGLCKMIYDMNCTIQDWTLPVGMVVVHANHFEELLVGLGPHLVSQDPKNKLRLNVVLVHPKKKPEQEPEVLKKIQTTIQQLRAATFFNKQPLVYAAKLTKTNSINQIVKIRELGVHLSYNRANLMGFVFNHRIFWIGECPPEGFKQNCALNGTIVHQISSLQQFLEFLPVESAPLFNNHPAIRMVIECTPQNNWARIRETASKVRALKLTMPILVWVPEGQPPAPPEFYVSGSARISTTSNIANLVEYGKCNINLTWAPEIRTGSPTWAGTITITDVTGQGFNIRDGKPGDPYMTFSVGTDVYKTEIAKKEANPRWAPLAYLKCDANSEIVVQIYDKDKNGLKGRLDITVASLLKDISCYFRSPTSVRTFAIPRVADKKAAKGAAAASPFAGVVTMTFMFSTEDTAVHEYVPGYGRELSYHDIFYANTECFPVSFPTSTNLLTNICGNDKNMIKKTLDYASNSRSVLPKSVAHLMAEFLTIKQKYGTNVEKQVFKGMTVESFTTRLISKRPLSFYLKTDETLLRDGTKHKDWDRVGSDNEGYIKLREYISYDEMLISALVSVATPGYFVNNGERRNSGKQGDPGSYEPEGVYVAMIGARFEHSDRMESTVVLVAPQLNTKERGYGKDGDRSTSQGKILEMWARFYGQGDGTDYFFPTWDETVAIERAEAPLTIGPGGLNQWTARRFFRISDTLYFNVQVYKRRMRLAAENFFFSAQKYAMDMKKKAYCHLVGIGLGAWGIPSLQVGQAEMMLEAFWEVLESSQFSAISDINFSWFPTDILNFCGIESGKMFTEGGNNIKIHFSKRNPSEPVNNPSKVLVAQYAWDSNSFPGNEYWEGPQHLTLSGDPAAAASSTIPQLQNPIINPCVGANVPLLVPFDRDIEYWTAPEWKFEYKTNFEEEAKGGKKKTRKRKARNEEIMYELMKDADSSSEEDEELLNGFLVGSSIDNSPKASSSTNPTPRVNISPKPSPESQSPSTSPPTAHAIPDLGSSAGRPGRHAFVGVRSTGAATRYTPGSQRLGIPDFSEGPPVAEEQSPPSLPKMSPALSPRSWPPRRTGETQEPVTPSSTALTEEELKYELERQLKEKMEAEMQARLAVMQAQMDIEMQRRVQQMMQQQMAAQGQASSSAFTPGHQVPGFQAGGSMPVVPQPPHLQAKKPASGPMQGQMQGGMPGQMQGMPGQVQGGLPQGVQTIRRPSSPNLQGGSGMPPPQNTPPPNPGQGPSNGQLSPIRRTTSQPGQQNRVAPVPNRGGMVGQPPRQINQQQRQQQLQQQQQGQQGVQFPQ